MSRSGMGGGPDSSGPGGMGADGNVDGGSGGGPSADYGGQGEFDGLGFGNATGTGGSTMGGPTSTDRDPDVQGIIDGALDGMRGKGVRGRGVKGLTQGFDPSAAPVGVNTEATQNFDTGSTQPGGLGPNPVMGSQLEAREFRGVITGFLDGLKGKPTNQQEREVKSFLDNPRNQRNLRNLSVDYANNINEAMGWGRFTPGLASLHASRNALMSGFRAMGLTPGVNTPEMDALESLAGRLGVSIDSRSEGGVEMPGYRWDEETQTYKKITELNQGMLTR